jgi:hypothetical protein
VQFVAPSTSGNLLTSNGTTWLSSPPAGGTVTSVATNNGLTGGTITSSGTLGLDLASGSIGTHIVAAWSSAGNSNTPVGQDVAASALRVTGNSASTYNIINTFQDSGSSAVSNPGLSGTWRSTMPVGSGNGVFGNGNYLMSTVWKRIS